MTGPPARSDERRAAIVDRLADHVLAHGLAASSLRPLAKATGLSDRMLLYHFRDKADVMTAAIARLMERLIGLLNARRAVEPLPTEALRRHLLGVLLSDDLWPYLQLWLDIATHAARGDTVYLAVGERIGREMLGWMTDQLDDTGPAGREADAASLLVTIEGVVVLHSVGLGDVCRRLL